MKDYKNQILKILKSSLIINDLKNSERVLLLEFPGILKAIQSINLLIQNEVTGLEQQLVDLTEQLSETDSLLIEAKKVDLPRISHQKSKTYNTRTKRTYKIRNELTNQ